MLATELSDYLREQLGDAVVDAKVAYDQLTLTVEPHQLPEAARLCRDDPALGFEFFDFLCGIDEREHGFSVVTHLYSVQHRHHVTLRVIAQGGREAPTVPTLTGLYRGANWHEREAYDMFGIEFEGHPGLLPRLLTVENFEGFPLRKDFLLTTREAKPWPGAKEPGESTAHGDGEAASTAPAEAPAGTEDRAAAAKAKAERAKAKAAAMRKKKAAERAAAQQPPGGGDQEERAAAQQPPGGGDQEERAAAAAAAGEAPVEPKDTDPHGAADIAETAIAKDAAAGAVPGDTAAGAPGDVPGEEQPVEDPAAEVAAGEGAPPTESGTPGIEKEGRREGADDQSGDSPAGERSEEDDR